MDKPTDNVHPVHPLVRKRWSPRVFSGEPVAREVLLRLFEAARWAPSSFNEQPWAFFVATTDTPDRRARFESFLNPFNRAWASSAPVLLVTATRRHFTRNGKPNRHAEYDLGQAMAWLTVQATAEGLWVHQIAGFDDAAAAEQLGLPEGIVAVSMVAIGHAGSRDALSAEEREREAAPRVRRDQDDFVHGDRLGSPW